jgi:hypothetical protein
MNDAWREAISYVPTPDGIFEQWMDNQDPSWRYAGSATVSWYREIWEAGVKYGREGAFAVGCEPPNLDEKDRMRWEVAD